MRYLQVSQSQGELDWLCLCYRADLLTIACASSATRRHPNVEPARKGADSVATDIGNEWQQTLSAKCPVQRIKVALDLFTGERREMLQAKAASLS